MDFKRVKEMPVEFADLQVEWDVCDDGVLRADVTTDKYVARQEFLHANEQYRIVAVLDEAIRTNAIPLWEVRGARIQKARQDMKHAGHIQIELRLWRSDGTRIT
jgi:hypothetical protein